MRNPHGIAPHNQGPIHILKTMPHTIRPALLATGSALPALVRTNDDPVFAWLREHTPPDSDLFRGLSQRRVLQAPETLEDLLTQSCAQALRRAGVALDEVDLLVGSASVSPWVAPNALALVHQRLGLGRHCRVLPLNSDYTPYLDGLRVAQDMVRCGTVRHALVACGNNWTAHVDYHEPVALAAGDGAGAALVGPARHTGQWELIDWANDTQTQWYGAFRMAARPLADGGWTTPLMKLDDQLGHQAFTEYGLKVPPQVVLSLLTRHGLSASEVTLFTHQTSEVVQQAWEQAIAPARYPHTLKAYGDMVSSSVAVNLDHFWSEIRTPHVVLMGVGMEMHATALLLTRRH
jgi:3-oxoacyl-[acyl-carrier-protein] synthase-3